ncbi:MAG: response regulator [Planctomycetota bacterium]|jgi:DNA-binding NtrC family response regulator
MTGNSKAHIFVVDDDRDMLDVVSLILDRAKFECTCFTNADDCLQHLDGRSCDLLITDVKMPSKDGIELLLSVCRFHTSQPTKP